MTKKNQHILFIIPYFYPAWRYGGTVKASFDFASRLSTLGYNLTILTTDVNDDDRNPKLREKVNNIQIIRFKNFSNRLAKNFNLYLPLGMKKWLNQHLAQFDLVHIHEIFTYQSIMAMKLCLEKNIPYIIQPHGSLSDMAKNSRFSQLKKMILRKYNKLFLNCYKIIALTENEKREIINVLPETKQKIVIIPNGINLQEFNHIPLINLPHRYKFFPKKKIIVFLGRINKIKGLDVSLQALSRIRDKLDFVFLIIGPDQGEKNNLEQLIKKLNLHERVIFTGLIKGKEKWQMLKSADLFLFNSRSEGLPTTLMEAAALGLPIISSETANFPQIEQFHAGFIVKNEKETAQKILLTLTKPGLKQKLSTNSLKLAADFDIQISARKLIETYHL